VKKTKISLIMPSFSGGGAQKVLVMLANNFEKKGFHVDLVVLSNSGPNFDNVNSGVNIVNLNKSRVLISISSLIRYFNSNKPNAILVTIHHISIAVIIAIILSKARSNVIIRQPNYLSKTIPQNFFSEHYLKIVRFFYNKANGIVAISNGVSSNLKNKGINKVTTIYNPVESDIIELASQRVNFKKTKPLIIGVGRLERQKNFEVLINAFAKVLESLDADLIILGDGPLKIDLENQVRALNINERVKFLGYLENPYPYIKKADVLALSSLWEGFGNVILESLALGTQVVSTDCPSGPSEILNNGEFGRLTLLNDSDDLAKKIIEAVKQPYDKKMLVKRSRDFAEDKISQQYLDILLTC
jgi:glycosyltransferase involved in cell wall biosynthesis